MAYDEGRAARHDEGHPNRFAEAHAVSAALARLVPDGGTRMLELGVGTGLLAIRLASLGYDVWGVDASEPMLARLRAKPGGDGCTPPSATSTPSMVGSP